MSSSEESVSAPHDDEHPDGDVSERDNPDATEDERTYDESGGWGTPERGND